MVDGFWLGWMMDKDAYSMDDATKIVSRLGARLFGEAARAQIDGEGCCREQSRLKSART